jgi:hypothetical protein
MDVVFVIGLAIEVAGATLLAAEVLTQDPFAIARRGLTLVSSDEPQREAQREFARALVGFGLLGVGVSVQLVGYAADGGWWLLALAVAVIAVAYLAGRVVGDRFVTSWLHRQAVAYWQRVRAGSQ